VISLPPEPHPAEYLRCGLAYYRQQGLSFDDAWWEVLARSLNMPEREVWVSVFEATRDAWERAYNHEPDGASRALNALAYGRALTANPKGRPCKHCDEPIPPGRRRRALYCSDRCRRQATYERERVAA
jgi:hypothetical protein